MKHALITGITGQDGSYLAEPVSYTHLVSAEADDFFELSGGLPQASPPRIEEKSLPILVGKQRASLGG